MSVSGFLRASAVMLAVFCVVQFNLQAASTYKLPDHQEDWVPVRSDDNIAMAPRNLDVANLEGRGTEHATGRVGAKLGGTFNGSLAAEAGARNHLHFEYRPKQGLIYDGDVDSYGKVNITGPASGFGLGTAEGQGEVGGGFLFGHIGSNVKNEIMKHLKNKIMKDLKNEIMKPGVKGINNQPNICYYVNGDGVLSEPVSCPTFDRVGNFSGPLYMLDNPHNTTLEQKVQGDDEVKKEPLFTNRGAGVWYNN